MRKYVDDLRSAGTQWTVAVETEHRIAIVPLVWPESGWLL